MLSSPAPVEAFSTEPNSNYREDSRGKVSTRLSLHLIGNAHLDPVWLWDWREGMNEGIATCRAMVDMLRDFPEFRFIRGEAAIYQHIERHAPELFSDIAELVKEGRWDIVGGTWIQPDTNLPSTEALLRQFARGKDYFRKAFGAEVTAAWAADSFGHSAGLPEILHAAGMESFAFTRPQAKIFPLQSQAFWWRARSGARILAYRPYDGWYASERVGIAQRLDDCVAQAVEEGAQTAALFYGLGNHGGGPSRLHLHEIREWISRHPEVRVEHSGLHQFFADLREELDRRGDDSIPTVDGELNFCLRGCSASVARFKYAYRRAEAQISRTDRTAAFINISDSAKTPTDQAPMKAAWDMLLFNAFHDILPGTSIERAYADQISQIGYASSVAQSEETTALTKLALKINTREGAWRTPEHHPLPQPVLVWNPHPWTSQAQVEVEVSLDHRPVWPYQDRGEELPLAVADAGSGQTLPLQVIAEEHDSFRHIPWRRRVVVPVTVPPMGWTLLHMGLDPDANAMPVEKPGIEAMQFECVASVGAPAVHFVREGTDWLPAGLQVRLYEDTWGAWGGMTEEADSWLLTKEIERLVITETAVIEEGPLRRATWVRFEGKEVNSWLEISFYTNQGEASIVMSARAFMAERGVRMKIVLPVPNGYGEAEYAVPGGTARRAPCGEVPGIQWVRASKGAEAIGFASDALYGFDTTTDELRATVARTSRYASDVNYKASERPWQSCADLGEHAFRAILTPDIDGLPRMAEELASPMVVLPVPISAKAQDAELPLSGSLFHLDQPSVRLVGVTQTGDADLEICLQNQSETMVPQVTGQWFGTEFQWEGLAPYQIVTRALSKRQGRLSFQKIS